MKNVLEVGEELLASTSGDTDSEDELSAAVTFES